MASVSYEIGEVSKRYACSTEIPLVQCSTLLEQSRIKIKPDTIMATWGRVNAGDWDLVSVSVVGARIVADELRANDRRVFSYSRTEFAPRWVIGAAMSNKPDMR